VTATTSSKFESSSPAFPCPICGRDDKAGDCRISAGLVLCHHGSTFSPPSLAVGATTLGNDGQTWAYTGEASDGRCAVFALDKPKPGAWRTVTTGRAPSKPIQPINLALLPEGADNVVTMGIPGVPSGVIYDYSPFHRVQRTKEKQFYSHHRLSEDAPYETGKGEVPWPLYNQDAVVKYGPFNWALEVEGEKCCDIATSSGMVCFSQPGNKALCSPSLLEERYAYIHSAGLAGVVYIMDNDKEGESKGKACLAAATAAGLPMVALKAAEVWPGIPAKGSIDDLPEPLDRSETIATIEKAANEQWQKQNQEAGKKEKAAAQTKPPVLFEDCWQALEAHADELAKSNDSALKQRSSLANKATDLGINRLTQSDLEKLIYAAQKRSRPTTKPLINGGTFTKKRQPFAVAGLIRHGLNMLVSNAGVGKSRMCGSLAAAWLNGLPTWLGRKLTGPPVEERQVLIIGTDQTIEDWAITLEPVGLCTSLDPLGGDDDEEMKLDPRITLHTLETDTKLDADGLAIIRQWADNHPNCMIIVDSFTTCLPPGIDEEKTSAAQPLYQLQEAMGSCWCIVAHHMRKAAGKEGSIGVGAGRGSSAIDGAVSRFLTLSPIYKMENGVMVAQESDTRRQLVSTKRGGATEHLIVDSADWSLQGSAEALKVEERRERAKGGLNDDQQACLDVLVEAPDKCHTTREVAEAIGIDWADEKKSQNVRRWLNRLVALSLVDRFSSGREGTFKAKP